MYILKFFFKKKKKKKMSSVFVDPLPFNKGNPLTKASGREDLIYCLYRLTLVIIKFNKIFNNQF